MYYIGAKEQVESYINKVDARENYKGTTSTWVSPIKHPSKTEYAVIKHQKHNDAEMQFIEKLPEDWQPKYDI